MLPSIVADGLAGCGGRMPILLPRDRGRPVDDSARPERQVGNAGLGLFLSGNDRSLSFSHGGANAGYRCFLIGFPATRQGAVLIFVGFRIWK